MLDPCVKVVSGIVCNFPDFQIVLSGVMVANEPVNNNCVIFWL